VVEKAVVERLRLRENFDRINFAIHKEKEMADFRRWFIAFAALVLVLGATVPASAQTNGPSVSCSVNTLVTPTIRHEGLTELVGDILLVCQRNPGSPVITTGNVPQVNISVSLGGATLSTSSAGSVGGLDALLFVDDPVPANQDVCPSPQNGLLCPVAADGGQTFNQPGRYNVFQGVNTPAPSVNSITFLGVPVDPPATGSLTYRITNVRIQGPSVTAGAFGLTPVYAFVSSSSSTSLTIAPASSTPVIAYVAPGLIFSATGTNPQLLQCLSYQDLTPIGTLTYQQGFPNAFKIQDTPGGQNTPGIVYYTESGVEVPVTGGTTGMANTPTELEAVITNVPAGVQIWVDSTSVDGSGIAASLVSPTPIATSGNQVEILDTTGNANTTFGSVTVIWKITNSNPVAYSSDPAFSGLEFGAYVTFTGTPGAGGGTPATSVTAYAQGGFAPQVSSWTNGGAVPEFVIGLSPAAPGQSLFTVSLCQTILLFPYVTDFYGFDTGIAISNTSLDNLPVPAAQQTGACSVAFYDNGGLSANIGTSGNTPGYVNSDATYGAVGPINGDGNIMPGQTWAFSLSNSDSAYNSTPTAGTTGYAIATCNFQYAHGYSFVSDTGIRNFAAAYLALIIPDAPRAPQPFVCAGSWSCTGQPGEQLVH